MPKWPGSRNVHCVIDRVSHRAFTSSLKPPTSAPPQLPTQRHFLASDQLRHLHYHNLPSSRALVRTTVFNQKLFHIHPTRIFSRTMSSDDAYLSFLDKANADLDIGRSQQTTQSSSVRTETVSINARIPAPLTSVDAFYVSETDEPFEPVALQWKGASRGIWPDPDHFSNLISPGADLTSIETLSPSSFDPKNQYASAFRAVRTAAVEATGGRIDESAVDVKVYRVEVGRSRVEYYLLALDVEGGLIVGLRAKAIES